MPRIAKSKSAPAKDATANLGFEAKLWLAAGKLRNNMVALPGQLFYSTQIPVCLWFLTKDKSSRGLKPAKGSGDGLKPRTTLRDRRKETLFIDARKMGTLIDRVHRELTDADIAKIVDTYHAWLGLPSPNSSPAGRGQGEGAQRRAGDEGNPANAARYEDVPGFCKSATTEDIASHGWVLTPGRYVGTEEVEEVEDDGEPFEEKMPRLVAELNAQFAESAKLETTIRNNLKGLGYGI